MLLQSSRASCTEILHEEKSQRRRKNAALVETYEALLKQCGARKSLIEAKRLHSEIISRGLDCDTYLGNLLVQMFGKCGSLPDAKAAFNRILNRNIFSWTILISACVSNDDPDEALQLLRLMESEGIQPNSVTFVSILTACSNSRNLIEGARIHSRMRADGLDTAPITGNALITMHSSCGSLEGARDSFQRITCKDVVSWTVMISALNELGFPSEALHLFREMELEFSRPDRITFISLIESCTSLKDLKQGRSIHERILASGEETDAFVGASLITFFGKCGEVQDAEECFRRITRKDQVCWNSMLAAYSHNSRAGEALDLYEKMVSSGVRADDVSFITLLECCSSSEEYLDRGKQLHSEVLTRGYHLSHPAVLNSLLNMYSKCGDPASARALFEDSIRNGVALNIISWNTMISGAGLRLESLELYRRMDLEGMKPNSITFSSMLPVCTELGKFSAGREIHLRSLSTGECSDTLKNSLIAFYAGIGDLGGARAAFRSIHRKSVVSWSSFVAALARNGDDAVESAVWEMQNEGVEVNELTATSILEACAAAGLAEAGRRWFEWMSSEWGVAAGGEHYGCLVSLLGKCGEAGISVAAEMIQQAEVVAGRVEAWRSLVGACVVHGERESGVLAAMKVLERDPGDSAVFCLVQNNNRTK